MQTCDFCGSMIPDTASFCGQCGKVPYTAVETPTIASNHYMPDVQEIDTATFASSMGIIKPGSVENQLSLMSNYPTALLGEEDEDEEIRKRAAILGMGVALLSNVVVEDIQPAGDVPIVKGSPQVSSVPHVQGSPQPAAGSPGMELYSSPTMMAPQQPSTTPFPPLAATSTALQHPHQPHPHHSHPPHHVSHGCSLVFIIAAIIIPILIILSFLSLGLTLFAPDLSLSGSTTVVQGGSFTLHGDHFIPGSNVTLTLDDAIPLYFSERSFPGYFANTSRQFLHVDSLLASESSLSNNTVSVGGDGTFAVIISVNPAWPIGKHAIKASETLTHRSAELNFTIYQPGTTPTPQTTQSLSPSPSANASPSPTSSLSPTATTTLAGLSCVNPTSLSLGPVSQGYNQPVSTQVTLCTTGTGTVNWTATWDQNAAPWLQLDHTSGQISAPGQVQINVSALAANLSPGSYIVTLTFTSQSDNTTQSLPVSFTVQRGCATGNPNRLSYNGMANVSDPKAQTITITNCGAAGVLSSMTQTNKGGNWLFASPTTHTIQSGASNNLTITASNLKTQLAAGAYTGSVTFKIGLGNFRVNVALTVLPAPALFGTSTFIFANRQCRVDQTGGLWVCSVTLMNSSTNVSLDWSASSGINGVNYNPVSGTLQPGQTMPVQITVPISACPTKGSLTFTGPGNAVNVEWSCTAG